MGKCGNSPLYRQRRQFNLECSKNLAADAGLRYVVVAVRCEPTLPPTLVETECSVRRVKPSSIYTETSHMIGERRPVVVTEERGLADELRAIRVVEDNVVWCETKRGPARRFIDKLQYLPVDATLRCYVHRPEVRYANTVPIVRS